MFSERAAKRGTVLERHVAKLIRNAGWAGKGQGLPLYLVGGSFRALARLDLHDLGHPLPVIHAHRLIAPRIAALESIIETTSSSDLKQRTGLSSNRIGALPAATSGVSCTVK